MNYYYIKQQIVEAIKHWKSVLKRIDESKSPLLDAFIEKFGEDTVISTDYKYIRPTETIFQDIYDIVNKWLFGNRLQAIPIDIEDYCQQKEAYVAAYVFTYYFDGKQLKLVTKSMNAPDGTLCKSPRFVMPRYVMSTKMPFMFFANVIAHEMIHQFTLEHGAELQEMLSDIMAKREHDPHGEVFKKFMEAANKEYGMKIQIALEQSLNSEFGKAVLAARKKLAETERAKCRSDVSGDIVIDSKNLTLTDHGNGFFTAALY